MQKRLEKITQEILDSYGELGGINHLEGPNLPSRKSIVKIVDELSSIIFPGFNDEEHLNRLNYRYKLGEKIIRIAEKLREELTKSIEYTCRVNKNCKHTENPFERANRIVIELMEKIPEIRKVLKSDVEAAFQGDPAAKSHEEVILSYPGVEAIMIHRIAHQLWVSGAPLIPRIMSEYIHGKTGIDIHPGATIGEHFFIDHGTGVVIGETTIIGKKVKIYQGVTLGALSVKKELGNKKRHPTIEDNVTIYAGATILGGNTIIGHDSVIGGNVWLITSVPPHSKIYLQPQKYIIE